MRTIQNKIKRAYTLWLFVIFSIMAIYVLLTGKIFEAYADAKPWIYAYIILSALGNIGALVATYYYLNINADSLKWLAGYEILVIIIFALMYIIIAREMIPEAYGNLNFASMLNAVLPLIFILLMLIDFMLSKALQLMMPKILYKTK